MRGSNWERSTGTRQRMTNDELREFLLILRQALLMVVRWIEKRYDLRRSDETE
jgi:hypothetical protein